MQKKSRWRGPHVATVLISLGLVLIQGLVPERARGNALFHSYAQSLPAPNFSLENIQQQKVNLQDFRGKVIVLNFWATW